MKFTTSILAAGMIGLQAKAARDAFAAHKMALETIFEEPVHHYSTPAHHAPVHHAAPAYHHNDFEGEYSHHYTPRHYDHEYV